MRQDEKPYYPEWCEEAPPEQSYRSILKWGDPREFKHPNKRLYALMKETFKMTDEDFKVKKEQGLEVVSHHQPVKLSDAHIEALSKIVGEENVRRDDYSRLQVAYGKTMIDLMRLRKGIVENLPDLVLHPRSKSDIEQIVKYCHQERIPITVYGGGSSVTRGVECMQGGISLDMRVHMRKVVQFNEVNQTITVEAGMSGPDLEKNLNLAVERFGAKRAYTDRKSVV